MEYRWRGGGGQAGSAIGLGCAGFAGWYGAATRAQSIATIRLAMDMGVTLLDVSDHYGNGSAEELVGQAVLGRRHTALIATSGGIRRSAGYRQHEIDGSPAYLVQACEASLRRLRVDCIDVYFLAAVDPLVRVEESIGALAGLITAGKVRHIGLRDATPAELRRAHGEHPLAAAGGEYSLWERLAEQSILPAARELGIAFVACQPLGRGFLSGRLAAQGDLQPADLRRHDARLSGEHLHRNRKRLAAAEEVAASKDVGVARLALAWLLCQGDDIIPIPGTRNALHLEMNVAAAAVPLTAAESAKLTAIFPVSAAAEAGQLPLGQRPGITSPGPPCQQWGSGASPPDGSLPGQ